MLPDMDKITQELNKRFAAILPEFYKRRIIFWYDEDREFVDKIGELALADAKVCVLTGSNHFVAKKLLAVDDVTSNYLVYCPVRYERAEDNWLLNIALYSEEFRADLNSIWMDEMGLPSSGTLRGVVKKYRKFFNSMERRKRVAALASRVHTGSHLHLAIMAAICGFRDMEPAGIIRAVLSQSLDAGDNRFYQDFVKYGADVPFWLMVAQATGYSAGDAGDLGDLAVHILLSAATMTMRAELLAGLDDCMSTVHQPFCYELVSDWLVADRDGLYDVARFVESAVRLDERLVKLNVSELVETECFPCINECILQLVMGDVTDSIVDVEGIRAIVERRRTLAWYDDVACYYEGLMQVANMQEFFYEHASGFHLPEAAEVWNAYTTDYYRMDSYYRLFHRQFGDSLTVGNDVLDDLFKHVVEQVEGLYNNWFLNQLGANWSDVCADELARYGHVLEVERQDRFYAGRVASCDNKVYVIVSDAFRFEVAASLTEQLRRETQCKVSLSGVQGVFPTITKFGMAALLPYEEMRVVEQNNGNVSVLVDGMSTDMSNRDRVLKVANAKSVALRYKNIVKMKRAERQDWVKGMDVVYVYHDKIDEASHSGDNLVFSACDDAIAEIKNMVRIICNDFGGTRILITADHGFLYTYSPLSEFDKVDRTGFGEQAVEYGRRYAIMQKGARPDYLMPVKFVDEQSGLEAFAPRENVRIKMSGASMNFVHGGISLQEMVVPVVDYQFLRNTSKFYQRNRERYDTKPVTISLLSSMRKISNMIFNLDFYQKEAVGDNRSVCGYQVYFADAHGRQVSNVVRIIADRISDNGQERIFRCGFHLKSMKFSKQDSYYLVIVDEDGLQVPQRVEFQVDIAFDLADEFKFFE